MLKLWEILVPADAGLAAADYSIYTVNELHQQWDDKVIRIAGGLSLLRTINGKWLDRHKGTTAKESMIPVRIAASNAHMVQIAELTKEHYRQRAVMYYRVSLECYIV